MKTVEKTRDDKVGSLTEILEAQCKHKSMDCGTSLRLKTLFSPVEWTRSRHATSGYRLDSKPDKPGLEGQKNPSYPTLRDSGL